MEIFTIASGSSGNCICVGDSSGRFLIDCGISGKRIVEGLLAHDIDMADIKAIFVTHEHRDHIAGLGVVARRYHIPIYLTRNTKNCIQSQKLIGEVEDTLFHEIDRQQPFVVLDYKVVPIPISHDAAEPVAYCFEKDGRRAAILTDLGVYDESIIVALQGVHFLLVEANHDLRMLETGVYPYPLKRRIAGDGGHLSNEACGKLLTHVLHKDLSHILLGHLSEENNFPDLALESVKMEITMSDAPFRAKDFNIEVAPRNEVSKMYYA